jgi:hypothetical protein
MSLLSCTELAEVQLKVDQGWADNRTAIDYKPEAEAARALLEFQTASFTPITGVKDRDISIKWISACNIGVQDCTDECDFSGDELGGDCESYALSLCKEASFSVDEKDLRNKIFDLPDLMSKGFMKAGKELDEWWAEQAVTKIESYKGINVYGGGYTIAGSETYIPAASLNPSIMGYMSLAAKKNKFSSPWMLSGTNLYLSNWNAQMDSGNDNGSGNARRMGTFPMRFDVFNVDSVNDPDFKTYMIERGSIAMATKTYYPGKTAGNPENYGSDIGVRYEMASPTLPGVMYEVHYKLVCSGNKILHVVKVKTYGDIFLNPLGCTETNTGVISFTCGASA